MGKIVDIDIEENVDDEMTVRDFYIAVFGTDTEWEAMQRMFDEVRDSQ